MNICALCFNKIDMHHLFVLWSAISNQFLCEAETLWLVSSRRIERAAQETKVEDVTSF